ncbi:DUF551 domain-containing protein [Escherichia coli]|nr:DUF551 domain-containing protein [Escherichia coli]
MSTITKERIELFIKNPLENGLTRGEQMELARIALASLEAEPVCVIDQSNLDYLKSGSDADVWPASRTEMGDVLLYRSATPAPVSVPAAMEMDDDFDSAFEHGKAVGWNAYRAAMLQAEPVSNSDELPLDYLQGHKDGLEWAAQLAEANHPQTGDWLYDDPIDLARAIRKGPDMPTVQGGNSPVTQDGWISCSERMPNDKQYVWCWGKSYGWTECDTFEGYYDCSRNKWWAVTDNGEEPASKVTHWMPLPEPPQEAK